MPHHNYVQRALAEGWPSIEIAHDRLIVFVQHFHVHAGLLFEVADHSCFRQGIEKPFVSRQTDGKWFSQATEM